MAWNYQAKSSSTYLNKLSVNDPWELGDTRIYLGLQNLTLGSFGTATTWNLQGENAITEERTIDIGGGFAIDIGGGYSLLAQPSLGGFSYPTPSGASFTIQPKSAVTQNEYSLNIGSGYKINIGGGYTLNIQTASTGVQWSYQTPN